MARHVSGSLASYIAQGPCTVSSCTFNNFSYLAVLTILGVLPGDTVAGPLHIISGALQMTLNASLNVDPLPNPPSRLIAGLIQ